MKKPFWKKGACVLLGLALALYAPVAASTVGVSYAYDERPAVVNASSLNIRSDAGTEFSSVACLSRGTAVTAIGEKTGTDGKLWYQVRYSGGGTQITGYALGTYLKFSIDYQFDADFEASLSSQGFPESYKDGLRQLHTLFPNWIFEAQQTGLDWDGVIQSEMVLPRSLVDTDSISSYKSLAEGAYDWNTGIWTGFDGSRWVAASQEILSYYMDPRNFLDQVFIFQFLNHEYDAGIQTREGLSELVQGTFLSEGAVSSVSPSTAPGGTATTVPGEGGASLGTSGPDGSQYGPGGAASGSSGGSSSNVILSPSGGSGKSGNAGSSGLTAPQAGSSPSAEVQLTAPQASLSRKHTDRVMSGKGIGGVTVGVKPGNEPGEADAPQSGPTPTEVYEAGNGETVSNSGRSYIDIIMDAAAATGVNPYVLAAMILQEQGRDGHGRSVSGTVSGYEGYYNFFNVGAYASDGMGAVERGLWYASQDGSYGRPWNTPEKSILGGAQFYGDNYVKAGQNTFYLKKYNVQGGDMFKHQYMTNVDGAASEASFFAEGYSGNMRELALHFRIPVYQNMPEAACPKPTGDGSPNNKLVGLGVEGFSITPTFDRDVLSYSLIVDPSVPGVNVCADPADTSASVEGTGYIMLLNSETDITVQVTAQNGSVRNYVIHVAKQGESPSYQAGTDAQAGNNTGEGSTSGVLTPGGSNVTVIR